MYIAVIYNLFQITGKN